MVLGVAPLEREQCLGSNVCAPVNRLPVTISACLSCSDDEDVAPLSAKFADIYPLNNYNDTEVVANMNGIHSELNGGGENMALKDEVRPQRLRHDRKWHRMAVRC